MDTTTEGIVMDISKLMNVKYTEKFAEYSNSNTPINAPNKLAKVVWELATTHPTWSFYTAAGNGRSGVSFRTEQFTVRIDNEIVGSLHHLYYRGDYCVGISNGRVGKKLEHGNIMRTKDEAKAVQLAKKYFGKLTVHEIAETAEGLMKGAVNHVAYSHERKVRDMREPFDRIARHYIFEEGLTQFKEYLATQTTRPDSSKLLNSLDDLFETMREKTVVDKFVAMYKNNQTCTVILNGGTYIVKHASGEINSFIDEELPDYLRGKVGLLKLSKVGQIVDGVGFRADEKTFEVVKEATC